MSISAATVVRVAFWVLALVALVSGYLGFESYLAEENGYPPDTLELLYLDLQLFVMELAGDGDGPLPATLEFARFAAPAVTVYTVVDGARLLLSSEMRRIRARKSKDHVVVCGSGTATMALVERLRKSAGRIVVISSGHDTAWADRKVMHVTGDARNPATLRAAGVHRARKLYACEADSSTNTAIALAAHALSRRSGASPLATYALIPDPELCAALRARRLSLPQESRLRLDFFNLDELAARVLLDRHPLENARPVVVMGLDAFGRALLVEAARRRRIKPPREPRLPITVVDENATVIVKRLCRRFEFISEACTLTPIDACPDDPRLVDRLAEVSPQRVFICYADQDLALKTALTSPRLWSCGPGSLVVRVEEAATFGRAFRDVRLLEGIAGALHVFSINDEACDPELIAEDLVETLARAIHEHYLEKSIARRETAVSNASAIPWEMLPEELKAANRAQAEDIGRKLASIGCAIAPRVDPDLEFAFTDDEVEQLAIVEHDRWVRRLLKAGWERGPLRDPDERRHPDLDSWHNLSETAKDKDRDAVRNLPGILSAAGFQIVRVERPARHPAGHPSGG
jgi:Kef-type K+ transport systems, predicted NAD-binding component